KASPPDSVADGALHLKEVANAGSNMCGKNISRSQRSRCNLGCEWSREPTVLPLCFQLRLSNLSLPKRVTRGAREPGHSGCAESDNAAGAKPSRCYLADD